MVMVDGKFRTSLITDPSDGRQPTMSPEAIATRSIVGDQLTTNGKGFFDRQNMRLWLVFQPAISRFSRTEKMSLIAKVTFTTRFSFRGNDNRNHGRSRIEVGNSVRLYSQTDPGLSNRTSRSNLGYLVQGNGIKHGI